MKHCKKIIDSIVLTATLLFLISCHNDEDYQQQYYYQSSSDIRMEIRQGMDKISKEQEKTFYALYNDVIDMFLSDRMGIISNPYIYLEEPEYKALKDFFYDEASLTTYYLLIHKYMLCEHGVFPYMFVDIMEDHFPELRNLAELKTNYMSSTESEVYELFPLVYVEMLLEELKEKINNG